MGGGGDPFAGAPSSPFSASPSPDPFAALGAAGGTETSGPFGRAPLPPPPRRQASSPGASPDGPAIVVNPPAGPGQWVLRTADGEELVDVQELRDRIKSGQLKADDLCAPAGETLRPARQHGALEVAFGTRTVGEKPRVAGARASGLSLPKPVMAGAVLVVALIGGAVGVITLMPELFEQQTEAGVNPLRRARPVWQRQFPDVEGTAQEHFVEGRKQMRLDTAAGLFVPPYRRRTGLVFQAYALLPHMTALQNIMMAMGDLPGDQAREEARRLMTALDLPGLEDRKPANLSGGQQQRVALARALARRPSVLLLDEPLSAVDRRTRGRVREELAALRRAGGPPVLLVTHDLEEAVSLADRLAVMDAGRILQCGAPGEVLADPRIIEVLDLG